MPQFIDGYLNFFLVCFFKIIIIMSILVLGIYLALKLLVDMVAVYSADTAEQFFKGVLPIFILTSSVSIHLFHKLANM